MRATTLPHCAAIVRLPFGPMGVVCSDEMITELVFLPPDTAEVAPRGPLAECAARALTRWIDDPHAPHELPLARRGTAFQRRVWQAISAIEHGHTRCYGELAQALGSAARAVGGACRANPFPLLTPCHRVIARHGLGGFAGDTDGHRIHVKQWLLAHEQDR